MVNFDVVFAGFEVFLFHVIWQAAFFCDGKASRYLDSGRAVFQERYRITARKNTTSSDQRDIEVFGFEVSCNFSNNRLQIISRPIITKPQMATR